MEDTARCLRGWLRACALAVLAAVVLAGALMLCGCSQKAEDVFESATARIGASSADAKAVASYTVAHVEGEPDWDHVAQVDLNRTPWGAAFGVSAHAQLCYDDEALHVRMRAEEPEVRAEHEKSEKLAKTYEDSCLEFFVAPVEGDGRYLNFEFNPNCAVCAEIGSGGSGRVRLVPAKDPYSTHAEKSSGGWEITFDLPFDFIRTLYPNFEAEKGLQMRGNFYKCGEKTAQSHYLTWAPVTGDAPDFHRPDCFGELVFG